MITLRQLRYLTCARPPSAFRAGGRGLRHQPAGAVDAGARARARDRRRAGRAAAGRRSRSPTPAWKWRERAEQILTATRDLVDFVRHRELLSGRAEARHHPDAGALHSAAAAAAPAGAISAAAAGGARDANQDAARRADRRRARLRDAGAAGGSGADIETVPLFDDRVPAGGAGRRRAAGARAASASRMSTSAG